MTSFVSWFTSSIIYGTSIMYGALGEILTQKSGHLNLGVPGMMFLGGFAGFTGAFLYEKSASAPEPFLMVMIPLLCAFLAGALGGLLYGFMTITLRANQNVTGLALTFLGVGIGSFGGVYVLAAAGFKSFAKASMTADLFTLNLNSVVEAGTFGDMFLSYGFMTYFAIVLAVVMHFVLKRTRVGLNLRAIGESPATADAAGINVTKYKYLSTAIGGGICGLGGMFYILVYCDGGWSTVNSIEALGWLAICLVIFVIAVIVCYVCYFCYGLASAVRVFTLGIVRRLFPTPGHPLFARRAPLGGLLVVLLLHPVHLRLYQQEHAHCKRLQL